MGRWIVIAQDSNSKVLGAVTVLVWKHYAWVNLYEIVPGVFLSTRAIVVVSLCGKTSASSVQSVYDEVDREIACSGQ